MERGEFPGASHLQTGVATGPQGSSRSSQLRPGAPWRHRLPGGFSRVSTELPSCARPPQRGSRSGTRGGAGRGLPLGGRSHFTRLARPHGTWSRCEVLAGSGPGWCWARRCCGSVTESLAEQLSGLRGLPETPFPVLFAPITTYIFPTG